MTRARRNGPSLVSQRIATAEGVHSFHAAKLGLRVVAILNRARDAAGLKNSDLAERLELSEGRVSQVLGGDGNLHVGTVGRFLAACGYQIDLVATPISDPALPSLSPISRNRRHATGGKSWDFFEQSFLNQDGVTAHVSAVPRPGVDPSDCLIPVGEPKLLASIAEPDSGPMTVHISYSKLGFRSGHEDWASSIDEAVAAEEQTEMYAP